MGMHLPGIHISLASALPPPRGVGDVHGEDAARSAPTGSAAVVPAPPAGPGFSRADRNRLLLTTGIGPGVVRNLEVAGFRSIDDMRRVGVRAVLERVCEVMGRPVVANRAQALSRVIGLSGHG